jgi:phage gp45-like
MYNYIRLAKIIKLEYVGELGRIRVQFQDPNATDIEEGVLIYLTGDNACPAVGDQCVVFGVGDNYGMNYVMPYDIDNAPLIKEGEKIIYGAKGNKVYLKNDGSISIEATNEQKITVITPEANFSQDINLTGVLKVGNIQVVGSQGASIANATGGTVVDIEARATQDLILTALRTHGLIA